jgi:hypothetical protein
VNGSRLAVSIFFHFFIFLRIFFFFDNECRVVQLVKFEGVTYWASKVIVSWKKMLGFTWPWAIFFA